MGSKLPPTSPLFHGHVRLTLAFPSFPSLHRIDSWCDIPIFRHRPRLLLPRPEPFVATGTDLSPLPRFVQSLLKVWFAVVMSLTDRNSPPRLRRLTEPLRRHTTVSFWSSKSWGAETTTLSPRRQSTSLDSARLSIQRFPTAYKKQILHGYNLHWKDLRKWLLERFKAHLQLEQYLPSADVCLNR